VGQNQSVFIDVSGVPLGDDLEVAYCSLAASTQVVAQPQCASEIPGAGGVLTPSPLQYQYGTVTSNQTVLAIPTEYDPNIAGAKPIVSQTSDQLIKNGGTTGSFFCDDAADPCAVEIMDIPKSETLGVADGQPPPTTLYSAVGHTVIFPLTFAQSGNGCGSAPVMQVDASYSVAQFIPAAGQATCNGPGGVTAIPTELPSVDDPACATGTGTSCPIHDVINGTVPVSFTDDPEDPATLAEEKQAGGKFAYIPIAVSATEIAFDGSAGLSIGGNAENFPLHSYNLTAAQAAGIMTQLWNSPEAGLGLPNDDVCGQLSGAAQCTEAMQTSPENLLVEKANGKTDNLDVSRATSTTSSTETFNTYIYQYPDNYAQGGGQVIGGASTYYGDTGYALLNPWPFSYGSNAVNELSLGAMWPSTASGSSFESTAWMCNAPNTAYTVNLPFGGQASVHDILSGQQILADAEQGPVAAQNNQFGWPPGVVFQRIEYPANQCQSLSTLPIDFSSQAASVNAPTYQPSSQPITAAHAVQGAVPKYSGSGGFAFTAMDSSEADFFGLLPANLQNAAGAFVDPSQTGVTAALSDATTNADGTLSPNYSDTSDTAAYAMPMVTYALVSTSPQPSADQATQLKNLLTNLVSYSHSGGTSSEPLPAGYFAMPSNLYSDALSEISKDIVAPAGSSTSSSSTAGSGPGGSGPGGAGGAAGGGTFASPGIAGSTGNTGNTGSFSVPTSGRGSTASHSSHNGSPTGVSSSGPVAGHLITVALGSSRYFVLGLLMVALFCLLVGPLLYTAPILRKRKAAAGGGDDAQAPSGPDPPEEG
jgi:hypothetical protein